MMKRAHATGSIAALLFLACSGGNSPTDNNGAIQIATYIVNPQTVDCAFSFDPQIGNIGSPDTVAIRIEMVNTTSTDASVTSVGAIGTILRSTDSLDVGKTAMNYESLPYHPQPATIVGKTGDLNVIVSLPTHGLCNSKPVGFNGNQDLLVSSRLTATSGIYPTTQATLHVIWQ